MKFPYEQYEVSPTPTLPSGIVFRPVIPLRGIGAAGAFPLLAFVDTGADETLLPRSFADLIGALIDDMQRWQVSAFGGQPVEVILGQLDFELTGDGRTYCWSGKVGFISFAAPEDEVAVLGHAGFLDFFRVVCDGCAREVEVDLTAAFPGTVT